MNWKLSLCCLTLLYGCSNPAPGPTTTPTAASPSPAATNFAAVSGESVQGLRGTPLTGHSVTLAGMVGDKLGTTGGAFFPLLQSDQPDQVLLVFVPNVSAPDLDKRESASLEVSGNLKPIEDAGVVSAIEGKLQGKLLQKNGKAVYLEATSDPWPAGGTATPGQTP